MSLIRHLAAAALASLVCALAPDASQAEPIASGETWLALDPQLSASMERRGVRLDTLGDSERTSKGAFLPVRRGFVYFPTSEAGVFHEGGLRFTAAGRSVKLRRIELDTIRRSLWARSHGERLRIASFERYGHSRAGYGAWIRIGDVQLARPLTRLLNRELQRPGLFQAGAPLGEVATQVQPAWNQVNEGALDFSLDPGFFAKLEAVGVETDPELAETIQLQPTVYRAPVEAGRIYPNRPGGSYAWSRLGLRLAQDTSWTSLAWTGLSVDLASGRSSMLNPVLSIGSGTFIPDSGPMVWLETGKATTVVSPEGQTLKALGIPARLATEAANLINGTFASHEQPVVYPGDRVGTVSVTMKGR